MVAIKLGLSRNGLAPSFYRRISVETTETGIDLLKRQAVLLFQENENGDAQGVDLGSFAVTLFYVDSDGDKVLICNESDLSEAIEEGQSHLRAAIKVHAQVTPSAPASTKSTQTFVRTCETGTQPAAGTVVDALADLVHSVAVTAQAGVEAATQAAQEAHREQQREAEKSMQEAKKNVQEAKAEMKRAKAASKEQIKAATRQVKERAKALKMSAKVIHGKRSWDDPAGPEDVGLSNVAPCFQQSKPAPAKDDTPFIHGRHTCDICLTSPIVGKRFHATNLPDYDLCGACHESYKGKDITFEETVLDRDRSLQERWSKKYARMLQIDANHRHGRRTECHTARRHCPEPRGPPHFPGKGPFGHRFPPHHGHPHAPPPFGPPHMHPRAPLGPRPPHMHPHAPPPFAPHPPPYPPPQSGRPCYVNREPTPFDAALAEAMRRSLEEATAERSVATTEESEESTRAPLDHSAEAVKSVVPMATSDETPTEPEAEPTVVEDVEEEEEAAEVEPSQEPEPVVEEEAKSVQVETVEESKAEDAPSDEVAASTEDTKPAAEEVAPKASDSFSSDAVDSGSVAAFMGETLDRFSAAIDSLNSEMGATIVDGDGEDDVVSKDDSWSVVEEDEQIAYDENLARAAVMIGSALFNSDNQGVSDSTSQFSSITTSSPTEMAVFTKEQASRWASQLAQLHDMNLHDDAKYIEVMEMLAAANIGSNEDEEITVTQVLNHTLDA